MEHFWEIFPVIAIFAAAGYIVKISLDFKIKKELIEKGKIDDSVKHLYSDLPGLGVPTSLKWGMVLVALGLGALIGLAVPEESRSELTISAMLILSGLALVVYYFVAARMIKKGKDDNLIR
jgi:Domain of unknown function (DUF6249)